MRIAIVASIWITVPPKGFGFGAQEYLAYYLAEGMKKKGHDVTLFASAGSQTTGRLISVSSQPVVNIDFPDERIKDVFELINLSEAYKLNKEFDLIHNHLLPYGMLFANSLPTSTLHTLHHSIYNTRADYFMYKKYKDQNFISISNTQRSVFPELNYVSTVYNGTDTNYYSFAKKSSGDYLLYIGRMKKYKGIHTAIKLAKKMNIKLKIAAPLPSENQHDYKDVWYYWKNEIEPHLDSNIESIGLVQGEEKIRIIQNAKAQIFPIEREEPFGMTIIEALSCGTPVIAYAMGAIPELMLDGENGFIINHSEENIRGNWVIKKTGFEGLSEAVNKIFNMPQDEYEKIRINCRQHVVKNFTVEKMVEEYEKVYKQILKI